MDENNRNRIAIGDRDGCAHMLKLPNNLVYPISNEAAIIDDFFKKEKERVEYFKERFEFRKTEHMAYMDQLKDQQSREEAAARQIDSRNDSEKVTEADLIEKDY